MDDLMDAMWKAVSDIEKKALGYQETVARIEKLKDDIKATQRFIDDLNKTGYFRQFAKEMTSSQINPAKAGGIPHGTRCNMVKRKTPNLKLSVLHRVILRDVSLEKCPCYTDILTSIQQGRNLMLRLLSSGQVFIASITSTITWYGYQSSDGQSCRGWFPWL